MGLESLSICVGLFNVVGDSLSVCLTIFLENIINVYSSLYKIKYQTR